MRSLSLVIVFCLAVVISSTDAALNVPCPSSAASGNVGAGKVRVYFYSPKNQKDVAVEYDGTDWIGSEDSLRNLPKVGFNASLPTAIYMHAYTQDSSSTWLREIRRQYDKSYRTGAFNLMLYDWSYYGKQRYDVAASWAPKLGVNLGQFLEVLQNQHGESYNMSETYLVSYSLSTHIAGLAGRYLAASKRGPTTNNNNNNKQRAKAAAAATTTTTKRLGRIIALDPTGVCFHNSNSAFSRQFALRPSDAELVLARHYDIGVLGSSRTTGGVDVFVNGGKDQPTSSLLARSGRRLWPAVLAGPFDIRSHAKATVHELLLQSAAADCRSVAYACRSYGAFLAGECADCGSTGQKCLDLSSMDAIRAAAASKGLARSMAMPIAYQPDTNMFILTNEDMGCVHHYQLLVRMKSDQQARRMSLESVEFELPGKNVQVRINNRLNETTFTSLLTHSDAKLAQLKRIKLKQTRGGGPGAAMLLQYIDHLEINYMSNQRVSTRANNSARYCPLAARSELRAC